MLKEFLLWLTINVSLNQSLSTMYASKHLHKDYTKMKVNSECFKKEQNIFWWYKNTHTQKKNPAGVKRVKTV